MSGKIVQTAGRDSLGEFAPMFAHLNDDVLFGEVWNGEALSLKTKCIITVVSLMASGVTDSSLTYHLENAKKNGVTKEEIAAIITHATMYVGWPKGWAVFRLAKDVWNEETAGLTDKDRYQDSIFFPIGEPNDAFAEYFVGQSYLEPISTEQVPVFNVTFEPECRNNWHIHKAKSGGGQMLICVGGRGYYQEWGKEAVEMTPGSVVNIPANVKHWHGAAPDSWFSHLAFEIPGEETANEWCEPVSEEEYGKLRDEDNCKIIKKKIPYRVNTDEGIDNDIKKIFGDWNESLIWSCLQGIMGDIYADSEKKSAMAILGDFAFYAGVPNKELIKFKPEVCKQDFIIMVPQNDEWAKLIEKCYGDKAKKVTRYATKKEKDIFDVEHLQEAVLSLPEGYELKMMGKQEYETCRNSGWANDLVSQYRSYDTYKKLGLGVAVLKDGVLMAGASSYSTYNEGIEVEIDTWEDQRRKGLAYACGAKLILECLRKDLYPSWDAQNMWSMALAEKLGYHFSHEYVSYEIRGF